MNQKIVILTLAEPAQFRKSRSLLNYLSSLWALKGFDIQIVSDISKNVGADVVIPHIDLTVIPNKYLEFMDRFPIVINGNSRDISKTLFSRSILSKGDDYAGKVVVKTVENYGGVPEIFHRTKSGQIDSHARPWKRVEYLDSSNYPIFDSIRAVPAGVWQNPRLIAEKFLPERDQHGNYCLRYWYVFGKRGFHTRMIADTPIVKGSNVLDQKILDVTTPIELINAKEKLKIDFGRMDYVSMDGEVVLFDVNRTPMVLPATTRSYQGQFYELAQGLFDFIG